MKGIQVQPFALAISLSLGYNAHANAANISKLMTTD